MKNQKTIISTLAFLCIVLASLLAVSWQTMRSQKLPYTIGTPVVSDAQMSMDMGMDMTQKTFIAPTNLPIPTIDFDVTKDSMGDGWTISATTTNFEFTPEQLGGAPVAGEGHMHLYIDNELIVMLSPWYHIDSLAKGAHVIKITLNNNDHSVYTHNGLQIAATKNIIVP